MASNNMESRILFEHPKNQSSILKVIGVGGGGSNAVNYMHSLNMNEVDFIVCNTDSQALTQSTVPNKIQLGPHLTQGLGAGANPQIGKQASEESLEDIIKILEVNTKMVFITAGMGGGTGTGGAPVIAKICKDLGILTVGIVTLPFTYEGRRRLKQAQEGIAAMREHVDTMLVISNDKLRQIFGNLPFGQAFAQADNILATAAKCITDVITYTGQINVDFADVCTVMRNGQSAILGSAAVGGPNRALVAIEQALNSPLLNDGDITDAKWILLTINSSHGEYEHTLDETESIQAYVQDQAGENCDVILGMGYDEKLGDKISVTLIATGFNYKEVKLDATANKVREPERVIMPLMEKNRISDTILGESKTPVGPAPVPQVPHSLAPTMSEFTFNLEERIAPIQQEKPREDTFLPESKPFTSLSEPEKPTDTFDNPLFTLTPDPKTEKSTLKMVIRDEDNSTDEPQSDRVKIGDRFLSDEEMAERKRFEEQKKAFDERADRLRRMSYNIKKAESNDEMESIPAFVRKNIQFDNQNASSEEYFSGYSVGASTNDDSRTGGSGLETINSFLYGKKRD
jgi:cell division protein FtsZ